MGERNGTVVSKQALKEAGAVDLALRACLAKMGPFRWAAVSVVEMAFPPV